MVWPNTFTSIKGLPSTNPAATKNTDRIAMLTLNERPGVFSKENTGRKAIKQDVLSIEELFRKKGLPVPPRLREAALQVQRNTRSNTETGVHVN